MWLLGVAHGISKGYAEVSEPTSGNVDCVAIVSVI